MLVAWLAREIDTCSSLLTFSSVFAVYNHEVGAEYGMGMEGTGTKDGGGWECVLIIVKTQTQTTTQPNLNIDWAGFDTIITLRTPLPPPQPTNHHRNSTSMKKNVPIGPGV